MFGLIGAVEGAAAGAARQADTLDILVNNAGISGDDKTPDQEDAGTFRRIYETSVFGVVAVTNAFLPVLRRSAHPRIVNVSSGTGSLTWATDPRSRHWSGRYAAYTRHRSTIHAHRGRHAPRPAEQVQGMDAAPGGELAQVQGVGFAGQAAQG